MSIYNASKNIRYINKIISTHSEADLIKLVSSCEESYIFIDHEEEISFPLLDKSYNIIVFEEVRAKALTFNKWLLGHFDDQTKQIQITKKEYNVLHIRLGDIVLLDERDICVHLKNALYEQIDMYILNAFANETVLLCDSYWIKQAISSKYNFKIMDTIPSHSSLMTDSVSIVDTLVDFLTLAHAKQIHIISGVRYVSNFSTAAHVLYDIPLTAIELQPKYTNKCCWNCKKLKKKMVLNAHQYITCEL